MNAATFNCPECDRPTLKRVDDMLAAFQCGACDAIIREEPGA